MEALMATYVVDDDDSDSCSSSDSDSSSNSTSRTTVSRCDSNQEEQPTRLPPPPLALLNAPNSLDYLQLGQGTRFRNFPHAEGNYALHVYIPVRIPSSIWKELGQFIKGVASVMSGLHVVDVDIPLNDLRTDDQKLENVALGREFHISLGRTVPIRVHQIESIVSMLRKRLQFHPRYWMDFSKWEVFVNDDSTRTFLSMEVVARGLLEIIEQICAVNEVYRLHNLPEFYKDPRPHISLAWALGDVSHLLKRGIQEPNCSAGYSLHKHIFSCKFNGIVCKIGKKVYKISKFLGES